LIRSLPGVLPSQPMPSRRGCFLHTFAVGLCWAASRCCDLPNTTLSEPVRNQTRTRGLPRLPHGFPSCLSTRAYGKHGTRGRAFSHVLSNCVLHEVASYDVGLSTATQLLSPFSSPGGASNDLSRMMHSVPT